MTSFKVHGSPLSTATMRVLATLKELSLKFEFIHVNMAAGDQKEEPHISLNPFGQVPAFEDGDLILFESRAINNYIVHGPYNSETQLIFADHKKMGILAVWMEVEAHKFDPSASRLAYELVVKPLIGLTKDEAAVTDCIRKLEKVLDIYETRLEISKYLGGDEFSLVDVHHQPTLHFIMGMPAYKYLLESRPLVLGWCQDILSRPAWAEVVEMQNIP